MLHFLVAGWHNFGGLGLYIPLAWVSCIHISLLLGIGTLPELIYLDLQLSGLLSFLANKSPNIVFLSFFVGKH